MSLHDLSCVGDSQHLPRQQCACQSAEEPLAVSALRWRPGMCLRAVMDRGIRVSPAARSSNVCENASTCFEGELALASTPSVWGTVAYSCRMTSVTEGEAERVSLERERQNGRARDSVRAVPYNRRACSCAFMQTRTTRTCVRGGAWRKQRILLNWQPR